MTVTDIIDEIKLELTGGVLELEIEDVQLELVIKKALRELQRYWDESSFVTIPYCSRHTSALDDALNSTGSVTS